MARKTISQLSASFVTGAIPTGDNFLNIFESNLNLQETGTSVASGSLSVLTDVTASAFKGDGSALTGITSSPFPFTGDAVITGSLTISGSQGLIMDDENVVLGQNAGGGSIDATDDGNVIIGKDAAGSGNISNADSNVIIGHSAGLALTSGNQNVLIGKETGDTLTNGADNICLGYQAGSNGTGWSLGVYIGTQANAGASPGHYNISLGYQASYNQTGTKNISMMYLANRYSSGNNNIALGYSAQSAGSFSGNDNIAIGQNAGAATTGNNQINIGQSVQSPAAADGDIRIGNASIIPFSGSSVTGDVLFPSTASAQYFSGDGSQLTNLPAASPFPLSGSAIISSSFTSGDTNSHVLQLIGSGSVSGSGLFEIQGSSTTLFSVTDDMTGELFAANDASGLSIISANADRTVKLGKPGGFGIVISGSNPMPTDAAARIEISGSTYFTGATASFSGVDVVTGLPASDPFPYTGDAVITGSLTISGSFNAFRVDSDDIVLGKNAGAAMIAGATTRNVLIGENAGDSITDSTYNVAIGYNVLAAATTGCIGNVVLGYRSGQTISSGDHNVAIGYEAGAQIQTGGNNVAIGVLAMGGSNWKAGSNNICLGYYAGYVLLSGANNIMIGKNAGLALTTGDYNILIGDGVDASAVGADNELKIGKGAVIPISASLTTGDVLFPSTASAAYFSGNGSLLTNLPASDPFPYSGSAIISSSFTSGDTNSNTLKLIGSGSVSGSGIFEIQGSTGTLFSAVDSMSGSLMAVTDASGIPILEVFSDNTVTANGFKGWRPYQTQATSFVLQLGDMGTYNRCGGVAVTASLSASSAIPFALGTEIEFFQTSSAGNLLITASAGSGITINSKNGNLKLAGQFSAATLKKVGTDEWDLIGDLT